MSSAMPGRDYSPRNIENCKSFSSPQQRLNRRARRAYAHLLRGMQGHQCWLITLTKPHDLDFGLRQSWHLSLIHI